MWAAALPWVLLAASCALAPAAASAGQGEAVRAAGRVVDAFGAPLAGVMVTLSYGEPQRSVTVWSDDAGRFAAPALPAAESFAVRARRIGWRDATRAGVAPGPGGELALDLALERESDPAALAAQLPANRWLALLLARLEDPAQREEFLRQCTYCHQQGSAATRQARDDAEWDKVLALMGRMGGMLSTDLRAQVPGLMRAAYDPASAVPALTAGRDEPTFAPPAPAAVRRAVVEEWELGGRASMQHDLTVHPDGRIYSVDMTQDRLYRLDPSQPGVALASFPIPAGDLPLGGAFATAGGPLPPYSNAHQGPHSIQVAPDGSLWVTLALGNALGRFDPASETWTIHPLEEGYYPHTLRFDRKGRVWFTVAASNHLGVLDPATGAIRTVRLPASSWRQATALRLLPVMLWIGRYVDIRSAAGEGGGVTFPVPYGVDVAPDGSVWFSQLNEHRIGRVDPESLAVEMIDTPFSAPRRLRFDSKGGLWIPGFSSGLVARFDPATREFRSYELPIEPRGSETPYALHVDRRTDEVWICGTNSDTLIRFDPSSERFTVYPLPTRVTYTREIDFDAQGRVWTSNSNAPTWQIEGGFPRVLRLDPGPADAAALAARKAAQ
jgi:streptogramin lyase